MAGSRIHNLIRYLRRTAAPAGDPVVSDAELLGRFAANGDEAAFELLAWRHGPMVLGVCRRVLGDDHDADDAFQATFLVLARKAASAARHPSPGGWLYTVAFRAALRARARRAARSDREQPLPAALPSASPDPADEAAGRESLRLIDEEVSRLPEKYRVPFVLFHLEGRSTAEVARELGCPVGTVESWLARARGRLRKGLKRRGLAPALGLLAALAPQQEWFPQAAAAARAALASCRGAAGSVSAAAADLAGDLVRDLSFAGSRRMVTVLVLLAGAAASLVAGVSFRGKQPQPAEAPPAARRDEPRPDESRPTRPAAPVRLATLRGHVGGLNAVALSGDGKTVASGGNDGQVILWDVETGNKRATLRQPADARVPEWQRLAHCGQVNSVAFSRDGKTLASGSTDQTVKLWDLAAGKEKATLRGHNVFVYTVAFSPDGRTLASAGGVQPAALDTTIRWDFRDVPKDPRLFQEVGELKVWDVATGDELLCFRGTGRVTSVAFSPDGMNLAFGGRDGTIRLWDVVTGEECGRLQENSSTVSAVAFAPDGRTLAAAQEGVAKLWDLDSGRVRARCQGESDGIVAVAFRADGRTLATAGNVPAAVPRAPQELLGEVRLWDAATGRLLGTPLALSHNTSSGALAARDNILAVGGSRFAGPTEVTVWDLGAPGARK